MWLINTSTHQLEYFQQCPIDTYAILSHRWERDEVLFDEVRSGKRWQKKAGAWKVLMCCAQAAARGIKYAWVDSCCIDKNSSAELSEAINSMFLWYQEAKECYVFMCDVHMSRSESAKSSSHKSLASQQLSEHNDSRVSKLFNIYVSRSFIRSQWFQRGWTLQELLAQHKTWFFDSNWIEIGTRRALADEINRATSIDMDVLTGSRMIQSCSVAQRMSWAANRLTTRTEDIAYCLLGIFDVSMPLLYGEGEKAFIRLQEAIVQSSDDETIFAWASPDQMPPTGVLAPSPKCFEKCAHVFQARGRRSRTPITITNKGIHIQARLWPYSMNTYVLPLACFLACKARGSLGIEICRTNTDDQYRRVHSTGLICLKGFESPGGYSREMVCNTCPDRKADAQIDLGAETHSVYLPHRWHEELPSQVNEILADPHAFPHHFPDAKIHYGSLHLVTLNLLDENFHFDGAIGRLSDPKAQANRVEFPQCGDVIASVLPAFDYDFNPLLFFSIRAHSQVPLKGLPPRMIRDSCEKGLYLSRSPDPIFSKMLQECELQGSDLVCVRGDRLTGLWQHVDVFNSAMKTFLGFNITLEHSGMQTYDDPWILTVKKGESEDRPLPPLPKWGRQDGPVFF